MNVYKLRPGIFQIKEISIFNFELDTNKKAPWYQDKAGDKSCFATCPACDNPIQLIGLYKKAAHTDKPYGRHYRHSIENLANYCQEAYNFCPYASPQVYTKEHIKKAEDSISKAILIILKEQFDRIIYMVSKFSGITISFKLAKSMLNDYLSRQGHMYYGSNIMNIPWIFAYMTLSYSLFGRTIIDESLKKVLASRFSNLIFNERNQLVTTDEKFMPLTFCYMLHEATLSDIGALDETMLLVVTYDSDSENPQSMEKIWTKEIHFDHMHFQNLINPARNQLNRNYELLALAEELIA